MKAMIFSAQLLQLVMSCYWFVLVSLHYSELFPQNNICRAAHAHKKRTYRWTRWGTGQRRELELGQSQVIPHQYTSCHPRLYSQKDHSGTCCPDTPHTYDMYCFFLLAFPLQCWWGAFFEEEEVLVRADPVLWTASLVQVGVSIRSSNYWAFCIVLYCKPRWTRKMVKTCAVTADMNWLLVP